MHVVEPTCFYVIVFWATNGFNDTFRAWGPLPGEAEALHRPMSLQVRRLDFVGCGGGQPGPKVGIYIPP